MSFLKVIIQPTHDKRQFSKLWHDIYATLSYKCVLEVGDTVKDKPDLIRFLVLCKSRIVEGCCLLPQCPPPLATRMT